MACEVVVGIDFEVGLVLLNRGIDVGHVIKTLASRFHAQ